jgi:hypothetical protein
MIFRSHRLAIEHYEKMRNDRWQMFNDTFRLLELVKLAAESLGDFRYVLANRTTGARISVRKTQLVCWLGRSIVATFLTSTLINFE